MSCVQVLLVAGTHGNECNAPWLFDQWEEKSDLIKTSGINVLKEIGNPLARKYGRRYIESDLNRSFSSEFSESSLKNNFEINRARELLSLYGPKGKNPCQIVFDFHSTTSAMGSSLVIYGRRPQDIGFASLLQFRLGLPIYLYEGDTSQKGFLVESWPCGLVVEIGPVAQGLINGRIVSQNLLILEILLEEIAKIKTGEARFPEKVFIHKHLENVDYPRDLNSRPSAFVHNNIQGKDWFPLRKGQPLFENTDNQVFNFCKEDNLVPLFINEAAYIEKNIAMSITRKEVLNFSKEWEHALKSII